MADLASALRRLEAAIDRLDHAAAEAETRHAAEIAAVREQAEKVRPLRPAAPPVPTPAAKPDSPDDLVGLDQEDITRRIDTAIERLESVLRP